MGKYISHLRKIIILPIVVYQRCLRPIMRPCCRFYPSCSVYAITAIEQHGVVKGIFMAFCRICRCHPWAQGGYDPIKPKKEKM